jgi:hypothetical protein
MMKLSQFFHLSGEEWEIRRGRQVVATVQGIRYKEKQKVDFSPETDVRAGDVISGKLCNQTFNVTKTDNVVAQGEVFCVEAYYGQPAGRGGGHSVTIGSAVGSAIMVGSPGANQTVHFTSAAAADLKQIVKGLLRSVDKLGLSEADLAEVKEDAEYLNKKLDADKPEPGLIRECLGGIRTKLVEAALAATASGVVTKAVEYSGLIGEFWQKHFGG